MILDAPSTELTVQDVHDTLRHIEQDPLNLIYPELISTAGGEDLGGGISVGLTSTLLDVKVAFQARKEWVASGTITTADPTGVTIHDSNAAFTTSGVNPGAWAVNLTDGSIASIFAVESQIQLLTDQLGGSPFGNNQWNLNDQYVLMNVTTVEVDGGNLVSVTVSGVAQDPILPTAGVQVVRTSASSATTQSQAEIEHSTFNGGVTVDVTLSNTGTTFPVGSPIRPVNNIPDAVLIANIRGFSTFFIIGDITLDTGDDCSGRNLKGESIVRTTVTINPGANMLTAEIEDATVTGTLDGGSSLLRCDVNNITFVDGELRNCGLSGTITLSGAAGAQIIDSHSDVPGQLTPIIDMGGSGSSLIVRNFNGGLRFQNKTGTDSVSIDMNSGQVIFDNTVVNGTITVRGIGQPVTDNSVAPAVIDITGYISTDALTVFESEPS
jgi:hypothetical protein